MFLKGVGIGVPALDFQPYVDFLTILLQSLGVTASAQYSRGDLIAVDFSSASSEEVITVSSNLKVPSLGTSNGYLPRLRFIAETQKQFDQFLQYGLAAGGVEYEVRNSNGHKVTELQDPFTGMWHSCYYTPPVALRLKDSSTISPAPALT
ncbi:hypothetical protein EJ06DRAFT_531163 [Trichodelitschia bisporula]|uniref:Uncharacterized protein n=1 Tax=Trichodelitschia bisporula TaxID=703511 RepID=A0A6G1HUP5_9PEZI|nr:hypothetical protein EJ06DRAFT_531163 [Trichodelitschia bisporula]